MVPAAAWALAAAPVAAVVATAAVWGPRGLTGLCSVSLFSERRLGLAGAVQHQSWKAAAWRNGKGTASGREGLAPTLKPAHPVP